MAKQKSRFDAYSANTAEIVARNKDRIVEADIMEVGEIYCNQLRAIRDEMRAVYWSLHEQIGKTEFPAGFHEQSDAIAKLGELGKALRQVEKAVSATSSVRCFFSE